MENKKPKNINFFYRDDNDAASSWALKIKDWIEGNCPDVDIEESDPEAVIVLGGDGTVLEAARHYEEQDVVLFGFNLGHFGFLTSVREEEDFLPFLEKFLNGDYWTVDRMILRATVHRGEDEIYKTTSLNEFSVQNPLGMVEVGVSVDDHSFQTIRGSGVLVSSATGSTAYNLSAHGPIVMPSLHCMIVTELLDHNIPTPPLVVKDDNRVELDIKHFRERGQLSITETEEKADVVLVSDGEVVLALQEGDVVEIEKSDHSITFAEIEKNHFLKSLQDKFSFK